MTRLQRRKFNSRYFSKDRSSPCGRAKSGSFSRAEKMAFWKCRRRGVAHLEAKTDPHSIYGFSQGRWLHGTRSSPETQGQMEVPPVTSTGTRGLRS